jgi:hypothetical protein
VAEGVENKRSNLGKPQRLRVLFLDATRLYVVATLRGLARPSLLTAYRQIPSETVAATSLLDSSEAFDAQLLSFRGYS